MEELEALKAAFTEEGEDIYSEICGEDEFQTSIGTFVRVKRLLGDQRRWSTSVEEIYRSPSGRYWSLPWERGNTEQQENEYHPEDVCEMEPYEVTVTKYRRKKNA